MAHGGVPVAAVVAKELSLPLEALLVREIGAPSNPELALGALTTLDDPVINESMANRLGLSEREIESGIEAEREQLARQSKAILGDRGSKSPEGNVAILVDDGLPTGASMEAAVQAARASGAREAVVGVPVAAPDAVERASESRPRRVPHDTPELPRRRPVVHRPSSDVE